LAGEIKSPDRLESDQKENISPKLKLREILLIDQKENISPKRKLREILLIDPKIKWYKKGVCNAYYIKNIIKSFAN